MSDFPILPIALVNYNKKLWFMENVKITHGEEGGEYWIKLNDLEILRTDYDDVYDIMLGLLNTAINKQKGSCFIYLDISWMLDLAYL